MSNYPLYDVPYLVREPNDSYMSMMRHKIEVENQAIVDDYFIERDKGTSAGWAQKLVARKNGIPIMRVEYCLRWYYQEAVRRGKYGFLQKFPPEKEHIVQFRLTFASDLRKTENVLFLSDASRGHIGVNTDPIRQIQHFNYLFYSPLSPLIGQR